MVFQVILAFIKFEMKMIKFVYECTQSNGELFLNKQFIHFPAFIKCQKSLPFQSVSGIFSMLNNDGLC